MASDTLSWSSIRSYTGPLPLPLMVRWCTGVCTDRHLATSQTISSGHPSLWCCSSPSLSTICQPEPSHCASLSTQHVRLSGVPLCRPDSLELAAWWT